VSNPGFPPEILEPLETRGCRRRSRGPGAGTRALSAHRTGARGDLAGTRRRGRAFSGREDLEGPETSLSDLRLPVAGVHVRVELLRQLPVRLLDLIGPTPSSNARRIRVFHQAATVTTRRGAGHRRSQMPLARAHLLPFRCESDPAYFCCRCIPGQARAPAPRRGGGGGRGPSVTLSEVAAETRVRLVESQGSAAANAPLDRRILAASLRTTIEERIVLSEMQRLKLFDSGARRWRR